MTTGVAGEADLVIYDDQGAVIDQRPIRVEDPLRLKIQDNWPDSGVQLIENSVVNLEVTLEPSYIEGSGAVRVGFTGALEPVSNPKPGQVGATGIDLRGDTGMGTVGFRLGSLSASAAIAVVPESVVAGINLIRVVPGANQNTYVNLLPVDAAGNGLYGGTCRWDLGTDASLVPTSFVPKLNNSPLLVAEFHVARPTTITCTIGSVGREIALTATP